MFVRFVTPVVNAKSGRRQGVFTAAYELRDQGILTTELQIRIRWLLKWFDAHLGVPDKFSRRARRDAGRIAISWFKDAAREHVSHMHALCLILKEQGTVIELLTTPRPGYIVFEDEHQVAAIPFADTDA